MEIRLDVKATVSFSNADFEQALSEYYFNHRTLDEIRRVGEQKIQLKLTWLIDSINPCLVITKAPLEPL